MSIETPRIPHLPGIQALRGVAALLVALGHIYVMETKTGPDSLLGAWSVYGAVGVDLFFVISGFIMVHVTRDNARGSRAAGAFLVRRAARIYPLYWLVSLAVLLVYIVRPDAVFSAYTLEPNLIKSFLLWPDYRDPLLAVGWTLIYEMMFYVIFALSLLLARRRTGLFLGLWAAFIIIAQFALMDVDISKRPVLTLITSPLIFEFILGAALALCLPKLRKDTRMGSPLIIAGASLGILAVTVLSINGDAILGNFALRTPVFAGPCGLIVLGLAARDRAGARVPKFMQALGDWSYSIYLTHILTLSVMSLLWRKFASDGLLDNAIMIPVLMAGSIAAGAATYYLAERPLIRLAKSILKPAPK